MNGMKTEFRFFDIMDYEKEAEYLSQMHARGWRFVTVKFPGIYQFIRCEPAEVSYQLDYNREGANDPAYIRMFEDMGWEYMFDFVGYSYFRKPVSGENVSEEIFCDDESRLDMVSRIFRGRMLPILAVFFLLIVPVLLRGMNGGMPSWLTLLYSLLFVLYLAIFARFTVKYINFKNRLGK